MLKKVISTICFVLLFVAAAFAEKTPTIAVHGFTSHAKTYTKIANHFRNEGWTYGGELVADRKTQRAFQPPAVELSYRDQMLPAPRAADFYLMDFSDYRELFPSQNLTLREQAEELKLIVDAVLQLTKAPQVILLCHSMGGMACRSYLQLFRPANVELVVFIATPHQGSEFAAVDSQVLGSIIDLFYDRPINTESKAMKAMLPYSPEILELNDFFSHPFPKNTRLLNVIVEDTIVDYPLLPPDGEPNDGVVTFRSQDLSQAAGAEALISQGITRFVFSETTTVTLGIARSMAHSNILENQSFITSLPGIINGTFPRIRMDKKYRTVRAGESFEIMLEHADFEKSVSAAFWKNNVRLGDSPEFAKTSDNGKYSLTATLPLDYEPGDYDVQFNIAGRTSNSIRITVLPFRSPKLTLTPSSTSQTRILVDIKDAVPNSTISISFQTAARSGLILGFGGTDRNGSWSWSLTVEPDDQYVIDR